MAKCVPDELVYTASVAANLAMTKVSERHSAAEDACTADLLVTAIILQRLSSTVKLPLDTILGMVREQMWAIDRAEREVKRGHN